MRFLKAFAKQPRGWIVAEMAVMLFVIALLDFITSYRIRLLPFYAVPIFVVGWFCRRRAGLVAALVSSLSWWCANWFSGDPDLHSWVRTWEICRHGGFFALVALTGSALRSKNDAAAARISLLEHSQRLEQEIVNISEAEQRRIGQDLHDGLCQYLAALACSATSLRDDLQRGSLDAEAKTAGKLATLLQDAVVQTRDLARGLVPAHVGHLGLTLALESLAESVTQLQGISCTFHAQERVPECDKNVATHLYRIAQEAIHNASRHGQARNITISLKAAGDLLTLQISDDGVGTTENDGSGMGLALMRYRARVNGGEMKIEQRAGSGTVITCTARAHPQETEIAPS